MNKKGFAISTMLYGLLIISVLITFMIISLSAFNKKSQDDFVSDVEAQLINYSKSGMCP